MQFLRNNDNPDDRSIVTSISIFTEDIDNMYDGVSRWEIFLYKDGTWEIS